MRVLFFFLLFAMFWSSCVAQPWTNYTQQQYWYAEQKVDHFDPDNLNVWTQKYFVIDNFWKAPDGPVLFYLCGEYTCDGIMETRLFPLQLAYEYGALVVSVEHRFYGDSSPADSSVSGLRLLSSRQALADFARFSEWFQTNYIGTPQRNDWFTVGGSYPGALSAWFRLKYPHLTKGSLASSAVIHAQLNFTEFDLDVEQVVGSQCAAALRAVTAAVEACAPGCQSLFQASSLSRGDFFFFLADSQAESVQYGHHQDLCDSIVPAYQGGNQQDLVQAMSEYVNYFFIAVMQNSVSDYDTNQQLGTKQNNARSWWWQTCTEFGWWQIARDASVSIRSQYVNESWYAGVCKKLFGLTVTPEANIQDTNNYYGGFDFAGSNVYFTNGVEDPWKYASFQTAPASFSQLNNHVGVANCFECGHCQDLHTPTDDDAPELQAVRKDVIRFIGQILGQQ